MNFSYPGFDGEDERRGSYEGTVDDVVKLVEMVLNRRKIGKIIIFGHFFGTWFSNYLILRKPERVRGFVQLCGICGTQNENDNFNLFKTLLKLGGLFNSCELEKDDSRSQYF